jgi:aminoglycoside phosphotransferase (APT) family kinase protein
MPDFHRKLVDSVDQWQRILDESPQALIHNDFNPRNICLRDRAGSLCACDWSSFTRRAAADLAELLCFVLPDTAPDAAIDHWIERHRAALACVPRACRSTAAVAARVSRRVERAVVNRLAMYALVTARRQSFAASPGHLAAHHAIPRQSR